MVKVKGETFNRRRYRVSLENAPATEDTEITERIEPWKIARKQTVFSSVTEICHKPHSRWAL